MNKIAIIFICVTVVSCGPSKMDFDNLLTSRDKLFFYPLYVKTNNYEDRFVVDVGKNEKNYNEFITKVEKSARVVDSNNYCFPKYALRMVSENKTVYSLYLNKDQSCLTDLNGNLYKVNRDIINNLLKGARPLKMWKVSHGSKDTAEYLKQQLSSYYLNNDYNEELNLWEYYEFIYTGFIDFSFDSQVDVEEIILSKLEQFGQDISNIEIDSYHLVPNNQRINFHFYSQNLMEEINSQELLLRENKEYQYYISISDIDSNSLVKEIKKLKIQDYKIEVIKSAFKTSL
tara:strand:+ start:3074 stop:3934 length:861 start_codon:yes stop_codon:yes gene_type:complete